MLLGPAPALKRSRIKPMSAKKRAQTNDEREIRRGFMDYHPYCMAAEGGAPHGCYGDLSVHEVWTRARGGPTGDIRNLAVVCFEHNRLISQDSKTMTWAKENGYLVSAHEGPRFLEEHPHDCGNPKCPFVEVT